MILRRAVAADVSALARLHRLTNQVSLPFLPELHTPQQDLAFFEGRLASDAETWLMEVDGEVAGYVTFHAGWIDHLFVHPDRQGQGLGGALLGKALEDGAERRLWTFQKNIRARGFYEKRGFVLETLTDGAGNEEQEPDALYRRPGAGSEKIDGAM